MAGSGNETSFPRVRGLPNSNENKCFFNAVIQSLAHTPHILAALKDPDEEFHLPGGIIRVDDANAEIELPPISGQLGAKGPLSTALAETLDELQKFDEGYYDAQELFDLVTNVCPQFAGGEQHDCHEFMRHFLENIKTEDLNRFFDASKRPTRSTRLSQEQRRQYMAIATEHIFSGKVFRGLLVSTLTCQECMNMSSRYEEFFDLSLPTYIDKLEELVATKRNAPKSKSRSRVERGRKRNTEQPLVTPNDTDDDVDLNGNAMTIEGASDQRDDDSGIMCNERKGDESPMSTTPINVEVVVTAGVDHNQLSDNFESMNLKEKRYKVKRTQFNSIEACLNNFTECEIMDENNKVACAHCAINTKATKQFLIKMPPNILILHLKRFEFGDHNRIRKISHHVKFPLQLDLSQFRANEDRGKETQYSLYAVVQHKQRAKDNGHYIAFVKVRPNMAADDPRWQLLSKRRKGSRKNDQQPNDNQTSCDAPSDGTTSNRTVWYRISDTDVETVEEAEVLKIQAYLLFYERI